MDAKEAREVLKSCAGYQYENYAHGYIDGMKDPSVLALVEALKDICHGCKYGANLKDIYNKSVEALAQYRQATKEEGKHEQ